jgi:hypothetical protein
MHERVELFIRLSATLTGFSRLQLFSTAMTEDYLRTLDAALPAGVLDDLLNLHKQIPQGPDGEAIVQAKILCDPKLGPVARNLILLWYCGSWTALPSEWYAAYGTSPTEKVGVVSAQAYQAGLQWVVIGAHAPGSSQQGFASWAVAPEKVSL